MLASTIMGVKVPKEVAIIGDQFMLSDLFEQALNQAVGDSVVCRKLDLLWPDEPMQHGYKHPGLKGLKEYQGEPEQVLNHIGDAEIFITHLAPMSADMFKAKSGVELLAVSRGGPVNIDMTAARKHKVKVVNTPGRNASAVAEFTIGAIIAETRNICRGHEALRKGKWRGDLYRADTQREELSNQTVGIIGFGAIGRLLVPLLKAFGCKILINDPYVKISAIDKQDGVEQVELDELLLRSDIVSLHARVTEETTGFMSAKVFQQMKPGAVFINTARGPMVDYEALYEVLANKHLGGAMLETFAEEPLPVDSPLLGLSNVTLTPHIAGASLTTVKTAASMVAEEVRRYLNNEPLLNPCS